MAGSQAPPTIGAAAAAAAAAGRPTGVSPAEVATAVFELRGPMLRIFSRTVACLAKLGRDAALLFRAEEFVLHGADDGHSTAMQFAFRRKFFSSTRGAAAGSAEARVVIQARALLVALRGSQNRAGQIDSLLLFLSGAGHMSSEPRLVLEFTARFGGKVRHRVPLLDDQPFLPGEPNAGPHTAALAPGLLSRVLDHCAPPTRGGGAGGAGGGCEEVTLAAVQGEGLRVQSHDLLGGAVASAASGARGPQANRTEVLVQRSDLEVCNLDGEGGEVTFSGRGLRDFAKACDSFSRDLEAAGLLDGSPLLELRFGSSSRSVVCRLAARVESNLRAPADFAAVLMIATRDLQGEEGGDTFAATAATQGPSATQPGAASRRAQPRQGGSKRRALPAASEAFVAFPDHGSQMARTQLTMSASPLFVQARGPALAPQPPPAAQATPVMIPSPTPPASTVPATATVSAAGGGFSSLAPPPAATPASQAAAPAARGFAPAMASQAMGGFAAQAGASAGSHGMFAAHHLPAQSAWATAERPAMGPPPVLAAQLRDVRAVPDSDDELIGADPDEVAFAKGSPGEDSVDWFDAERCVW